jgi:hypothetical protein
VNDLPVKFVETPDGGMDVLVWDFDKQDFVRNLAFMDAVYEPGPDVQELTREEFDMLVQRTRNLFTGGKREGDY